MLIGFYSMFYDRATGFFFKVGVRGGRRETPTKISLPIVQE